jgi:hypothetical protein
LAEAKRSHGRSENMQVENEGSTKAVVTPVESKNHTLQKKKEREREEKKKSALIDLAVFGD